MSISPLQKCRLLEGRIFYLFVHQCIPMSITVPETQMVLKNIFEWIND